METGERVLLVEGGNDIREFTADALKDRGYRVETAVNAEEALKIMCEEGAMPFDLVIADNCEIERVDGVFLAKEIAARFHKKAPKIIFTICCAKDIWIEARELNVIRIFEKPFQPDKLFSFIRDI